MVYEMHSLLNIIILNNILKQRECVCGDCDGTGWFYGVCMFAACEGGGGGDVLIL
jgi:hypothetical protein